VPKISYTPKKFNKANMDIIDYANIIIDEYMDDNLNLTLRQLYYQFVSRDKIANEQSEYKRLGSIISDARLAGLIDWNAIEDRTRNIKANYHNTDPGDAVKDALYNFMLDRWKGQEYRVEVWIEKEALVGVISQICRKLDVPYFACKGYVSQSEMWNAAQRFAYYNENYDQTPVIIHLGDHDPSGIDMTRDIEYRQDLFGGAYIVDRIALNMPQIDKYGPPPNPAKLTDSRSSSYVERFGYDSWELDALEPLVLRELIENKVLEYRDETIYQETRQQERDYKKVLRKVVKHWKTL
jgi:hypothetical protein